MSESVTSEKIEKPKPAKHGARWTAEDDKRLSQELRNLEGTFAERMRVLAEVMGRSVGGVQGRIVTLDLLEYGPYTHLIKNAKDDREGEDDPDSRGMKFWTQDEVGKLLIAHHAGLPLEELAADLHRTPRSLAYKLVTLGVVEPTFKAKPNPGAITYPKPKAEPLLAKVVTGPSVKISVTPEFQTALASIEAGENLLILGSAGTGKSTFLKWLRKQLDGKKRYAVLAPTGMAALNVGGQTIHSFFGMKPQLQVGAPLPKPRAAKVMENLDLIVVDEVSMVRADVFDTMDRVLRKYGKNGKKPFGGVQVVLMGDLCQLPPVVRTEEQMVFATAYNTPFFFSTPAWELGLFNTIQFTQVFRQTDAPFIGLLNKIRHGDNGKAVLGELNKRLAAKAPEGAVILAARNRTVDGINQRELGRLTGGAKTYTATLLGNVDGNAFTSPVELVLKPGARVMFTRNDKLGRWVNGSLGTVERLEHDHVMVKTEKGLQRVEEEKWEATRYEFSAAANAPVATVAGSFTQYPLTLAWALTIHKAQGQTIPQCVIDLGDGGTFAEGQLYVALSRARSLESLYLAQPIEPRHVKTHPAVRGFYEALAKAA